METFSPTLLGLSFLCGDLMHSKSPLDVEDQTEVLTSPFYRDHVHVSCRVALVGAHFAVDLDQTLVHNLLDFIVRECVLESVRGAKTPPSLSSIQCLGALRRLRCFLGPRTMLNGFQKKKVLKSKTSDGRPQYTRAVRIILFPCSGTKMSTTIQWKLSHEFTLTQNARRQAYTFDMTRIFS